MKSVLDGRSNDLLTAAMLACFVAAGWHFAGPPISEAAPSVRQALTESAAVLTAESTLKTTSIEEIRLGQRVVGRNPLRHETQSPSDITPENWRVVQLSMFAFGVDYDLQFLRPVEWLRHEAAAVGSTIDLTLPEMGLNGPAEVVAISPCPPIEPDDGTGRQIVTGLMAHPADNILDISITGLDEPLGVTTTHPIWSETRQQFVNAAHLKVGEHLRSETGTISQITSITPHRGPPQNVYNLEVNAEHVYQVGETGLLVHNVCPWEVGATNDLYGRSNPFDGIDIHHAGQKHPMSQLIEGYNPKTAPAIAVPHSLHVQIPTVKGDAVGTARDQLAKDIHDLRNIGAPNSALKDLIQLNKSMYPGAF